MAVAVDDTLGPDQHLSHAWADASQIGALLRHLPVGVAQFDSNARLVFANDLFASLYRIDPSKLVPGITLTDIIALRVDSGIYGSEGPEAYATRLQQIASAANSFQYIQQLCDGRAIAINHQVSADGGWLSTHMDVTQSFQINENMAALLDQVAVGLCMYDKQQTVVTRNDSFARMYGVPPELLKPGMTLREVMQQRIDRGIYGQGSPQKYLENHLEWISGPDSGFKTERLNDGRVIKKTQQIMADGSRLITHEDVTWLTKISKDLQSSQSRFHDIAEISSEWFWETDENHRFTYFSDRFEAITGLDPESILGSTRIQYTRGTGPLWQAHQADLDARRPFRNLRYETKDVWGGTRHWEVHGKPVFEENGRFLGYRGSGRDRTAEALAHQEVVRSRNQLQEAVQALRSRKQELDAILSHVPRAVITADSHGIITNFNPAAEEVFGHTADEAIGQNVSILMTDADKGEHNLHIRTFIRSGAATTDWKGPRRLVARRKDGTEFPVEIALAAYQHGQEQAFIGVAKDITRELEAEKQLLKHRDTLQEEVDLATKELKAKAEELELALAKERELTEMQRQFASMASHEFRTPLAIISGSAQHLQRRKDNLDADYLVDKTTKIGNAVERMTELMESTLSLARMDGGKISVEIDDCNIARLIQSLMARHQDLSPSHRFTCRLEALPKTIQADPRAVGQILDNLLRNAVKYSPGSPDIELRAACKGRFVEISVHDRGLGIDKADLPKLFTRFFRAATSSGIAGTGIGLHLVKTLTELHGGSVAVASKKGIGSIFVVRLPVAGPQGNNERTERAA